MNKNNSLEVRYIETRNITLIGAVVNLLLSSAQLVGGFLTHSQGLIADGFHTLSDLASDFVVLVAAKKASEKSDAEHPYGHGRIETLATSILGAILMAVAGGIVVDAIGRLLSPERLLQPSTFALPFAVLAVLSKEMLYHLTKRAARKIDSKLLLANAWHHRSDAISSILVIVGIIGSLLGFKSADALAAVAVALMIGRMGFGFLWKSAEELIDTALDAKTVANLEAVASSVEGVMNVHQLRTRQSGSQAFADIHIQVSPRISVSEGHQISEAVSHAISAALPHMTDVTVHTDAEDDCIAPVSEGLPDRRELLRLFHQQWNTSATESISDIRIHYLDGGIEVELYVSTDSDDLSQLIAELADPIRHLPDIRCVDVYWRV